MIAFTPLRWWTKEGMLAGLIAVGLLWTVPGTSLAQEKEDMSQAKATFDRYCASCHGTDAKGNGPLADTLKTPPADLTQISKKNGGTFPRQQVKDMIDGQVDVRAHGPRDMPVWGVQFREEVSSGAERGGVYARTTIMMMTNYLESIQEK